MALQSEVSPPIVGDPNKDTQIDGDTKSEDNDSAHSTDEDVDLEEGEILESEEEEKKVEEKDFTNISLKEALDKSCLQNIEQLVNQAKNAAIVGSPDRSKRNSPRKTKKLSVTYMDHDQTESTPDREDGWFPASPKYKSKFDDKPIDYRMELAAYRGTPPSSPDRKRSDEKSRKKRSSKKRSSKKSKKKIINRKDIKGQRVLKYKKDAIKGRICKFFKEGKCAKGSDCMFSHSSPISYKKRELCKFYLNGHCNKGKDCLFMHSEFPCKFYHTGSECYAKKDCRFSHAPLSEEMKRVLADYLRSCHGDDLRHNRNDERDDHDRDRERERDRDRKRRVSRSPEPQGPPPKRTCLLGSPPRHIREAEETKRWQEEMKLLQQQNHPSFEIILDSNQDEISPPHFPKPNFYQETLLNTPSPKRRQPNIETPNPFHSTNADDYHQDSPSKVYVYDENDFIEIDVPPVKQEQPEEFHWENVHNMSHPEENHNKQFNESSQQELDFTSDVKFDETTQFSEMESSTDYPPAQSPDSATQAAISDTKDSDDASNQETSKFAQEKQLDETVANQPYEPPAPPIVIPSHLPRKQQELFMRVLQHQRKNASTDAANSPTGNDNADPQIKKEPIDEGEGNVESVTKDSEWYTSEEEDDDDDNIQPISDLLKKIQQAPPKPQPQEVKQSSKVDLLAMFNTIQQKTKEKTQGFTIAQQKHSSFWENILGNVPASKPAPIPIASPVSSEPKRRTLLPDPVPLPSIKTEPTTPSEPSASKDPRLKNRDPRKLAREANASINIPKPSLMDRNNDLDSNSFLQDLNSPTIKPVAVVTSEQANEGIPYRLRGICAKPPNYTPYLHASQSNPSLLKDPRLRKHLTPMQNDELVIGNGKDHEIVKPSAPPKDVPPIPELLLKYEKPVAAINIFESSSSAKAPIEKAEDIKPSFPIPLIYDPRTKRRDSSSPPLEKEDTKPYVPIQIPLIYDPRMKRRDSRSNSGGSDTPPRLTIVDTNTTPPPQDFKSAPVLENALIDPVVEKKWLPPVLEKSWAPPILEKNLTISVKKDSDSNHDPPPLEVGGKSSQKKCLSPPLNEEFLTVIKKEIPMDTSGDSKPVVPPLIIKKIKPTPKVASHLPRAIADPRMAKLHGPRRPQLLTSDTNSKHIIERKRQTPQSEMSKITDNNSTVDKAKDSDDLKSETDNATVNASKEEKPKAVTEGKLKAAKCIPKKRRLSEKSEEKKKTVHRNRKSSMDYASPLNSCDATNNSKSLGYNSYNQRPKRGVNSQTGKDSPIINAAPSPTDASSIPEFVLSDSSNLECDNSSDVNLKDRFKTIDPTASPFC